MHIRSNDQVEVIAGADKGTRAKVLRILGSRNKVVVEGVARVQKHMRRSQQNPRGGRLSKEMPIAISNIMLVCPVCGKRTRTGVRTEQDGSKHRYCKRANCGKNIGPLSPARKKKETTAT
ncbi:MAG TPA: 50S ribosomal protein L24 [Pirellulales bacterium]|jgi:large subunit ribosomal protein L24|nr:50S ribosomal protein L24 [Pirellulales bacterium]